MRTRGVLVALIASVTSVAHADAVHLNTQPGIEIELPSPKHFNTYDLDIDTGEDRPAKMECSIVQGTHVAKAVVEGVGACTVKILVADGLKPGPATVELRSGTADTLSPPQRVPVQLVAFGNLYTQTAGGADGIPLIDSAHVAGATTTATTLSFLLYTQNLNGGPKEAKYPFLGRITVKLAPKIDELVTVDNKWIAPLAASAAFRDLGGAEATKFFAEKKIHVTGTWDPKKDGGAQLRVSVPGFENHGATVTFRPLTFVQKGGFTDCDALSPSERAWHSSCR